jgi:transposase
MRRYKVTDAQYAVLEPELPTNDGKAGHPWGEHRPILNGIFWRLYTGAPWRDVPERSGLSTTVSKRFTAWRRDAT